MTAYRDDGKHRRCLSLLSKQDYPDFEVIDIVGKMEERDALGAAFSRASGDVLLFINPDCYAPPDWVSSHMAYYPSVDCVVGAPGTSLKRLAFRNASVSREVLEAVPLDDIPTHLDMDIGMKLEKMGIRYAVAPQIKVVHDDEEGLLKQFSYGVNAGFAMKRNRPSFRASELAYISNPVRVAGILFGILYPKSGAFSLVHSRKGK